MIGQRRPSGGSAVGRRSRHFWSDSNAIDKHSTAAIQTRATWPMICSSGPAALRPSTKPAKSAVGKLLPTALYVHRTALEALDPLLRVYEGCARA